MAKMLRRKKKKTGHGDDDDDDDDLEDGGNGGSGSSSRMSRWWGRREQAREPSPDPWEEVHKHTPRARLEPRGDVYSFFMFTGPIEATKPANFSLMMCGAWVLVILNICLQGVVLYVILTSMTLSQVKWQQSVVGPSSIFTLRTGNCSGAYSMCRPGVNKTVSCAPPTVRIAGANLVNWEELDLDGDDVWTFDEALAAEEDLQCKYHVSVSEVFGVFQQMTLNHADVIWISPELEAGTAIAKPYFEYAAADVIMCGYRSSDMCANLLKRGIFDGPIANKTSPRVGTSATSAMEYCRGLLADGGICETTLPSTYATWRKTSAQQCLGASYSSFTYHNPTNPDKQKSYLVVDYEAVGDYSKGSSIAYQVYKIFLVGLFYLALYAEIRNIAKDFTWVRKFPGANDVDELVTFEKDEDHPERGPKPTRINGTSLAVRIGAGVQVFVRFIVILTIFFVGIIFLLETTNELNLLFSSISMLFIIDFGGIIYGQILNHETQERHEALEPMRFEMTGIDYINRRPVLKDWLGLSLVLLFLVATAIFEYYYMVVPTLHSVQCTCLSEGAHCQEAQQFSDKFWNNYWAVTVPQVYADVDKMQLQQIKGKPFLDGALANNSINAHFATFAADGRQISTDAMAW